METARPRGGGGGYGDFQLVLDAIGDRLLDIRETYAATLDEMRRRSTGPRSTARRKRFGHAATVLADDGRRYLADEDWCIARASRTTG